jgi:S1-C subfamily serine protease
VPDDLTVAGPVDYETLYRATIPSVVSVYRDGGGAGSGFVFDPDHVVTNEHVVRGVTEVDLRFADGEWRTGRVVGSDAYTDLAAVRVADLPADARPLALADERPTPGRPVAALGNPLGLDGSVTAGIVSGANRSMGTSGGFAVPDVVQTDAPINPGNSGGPLVAPVDGAEGEYEVVGVNRARAGDNVGFAVSPAVVARVVPGLVADGRYRHPYLRARTLDVSPRVARANGLDEPRGVLVLDGPDGLRGCDRRREVDGATVPVGGDVVVGIAGERVRSHEELMRHLLAVGRPGEPVAVTVLRDGAERTVELVPDERPRPDGDRRGGGHRIPVD